MGSLMRILDHLLKAVRGAAAYDPNAQVAPACILWPDRDGQWRSAIPSLQAEAPELYVLGAYHPARRTGPAIWLRCVLAGAIAEHPSPMGRPPILYLPGVSRRQLRAVASAPPALRPLAELQYRGVFWSQANARDWTIAAFLSSKQGGLALTVAPDPATRNAAQVALAHLLEEEAASLHDRHLDAQTFYTLVTGDPIRDLLTWFDQGDAFRHARSDAEWRTFAALCKTQLAFDPDDEGELIGAARLAAREGAWRAVWARYSEAPQRYPRLPALLRRCTPPPIQLFSSAATHGGWPQWNAAREDDLRHALITLAQLPPHQARARLAELEAQHAERRALVWAALGEAPLATAIGHLALLAEITGVALAAGTAAEMAAAYAAGGWRADDALLHALACVTRRDDLGAVKAALSALYLPWADEAARHLQQIVDGAAYPGGAIDHAPALPYSTAACVLFVDGLRFDVGRRLAARLQALGLTVETTLAWAALPSVTATAKPAVTPVRKSITGGAATVDFEPMVAASGQSLQGGHPLRRLLREAGWIVLDSMETGDGRGNAWTELGKIDQGGHAHGWRLASQLDALLSEIELRISQLLRAGWQRVHVVTDHGWLLFPDGLPRHDLAAVLTENKWGRCAAIKPGAVASERRYPWYWNPSQHFALADGIRAFRAGVEYAHGGLSLQECVTLHLTVSAAGALRGVVAPAPDMT